MVLRATLEKKEEKQRVRAALLQAALHLAAEHGFASLGLREVAREAGIAPTSFYRHFSDMPELGGALIRELAGAVREELAARVLAAPPADFVEELIDAMFATAERDPELVRFIIAERVGAQSGLREPLRAELAALAHAIAVAAGGKKLAPGAPPPLAAEAAISVLFDVCGRILDRSIADHRSLRRSLSTCLRAMLATVAANRGSDA